MAITPELNHLYEQHFRTIPQLGGAQVQLPLSTSGACIVDRSGRRVKLASINWSGAHMCRHCISGLEYRRLADLCKEVRSMGFNCVRLTFSLQMLYENPVVPSKFLTANPELIGKRAMDLFDLAVQ